MSTQAATNSITLDYLKTIGIVNNGYNGRGFATPYDLTVGKDGRIFVLNRCDPVRAPAVRVSICNLDDEFLGEFGYGNGAGDGQMVWPVALAVDSEDHVYVTDEHNNRVSIYDSSGKFISKWGTAGSGLSELSGPAGIAIDRDNNVYIAAQHNHRIQKFTADGTHLLGWGGFGSSEGQFRLPWGVAVDAKGNVYVADWQNDRVQKFTDTGQFLAGYGKTGDGEGEFNRPSGVAVDSEGYIYVSDWGNERIQVLGPDGHFQLLLRGESTLSKWAEEYFAVNPEERAERDKANLFPELPEHLRTPYHTSSQTEPYFWGPVAVSLDREDRIYVTEANRHRFQVYQKR